MLSPGLTHGEKYTPPVGMQAPPGPYGPPAPALGLLLLGEEVTLLGALGQLGPGAPAVGVARPTHSSWSPSASGQVQPLPRSHPLPGQAQAAQGHVHSPLSASLLDPGAVPLVTLPQRCR